MSGGLVCMYCHGWGEVHKAQGHLVSEHVGGFMNREMGKWLLGSAIALDSSCLISHYLHIEDIFFTPDFQFYKVSCLYLELKTESGLNKYLLSDE